MVIGMAAQLVPMLDQLPAPFLRDQVPFGFFRAHQITGNIKRAMDPVLVQNSAPGTFRRVRHIIECERDDPLVFGQAEWAQWEPTTDTIVQPNSIPFQATAHLVETIHFHLCPQLPQKPFQTSLAFACKRNSKTATIMQNHNDPPF